VVDSASLAVQRRHRRATTDRRAVQQGLPRLRRHATGARTGWRRVRVPRGAAADRRQRPRALATATQERPRVLNRRQGRRAAPGLVRPPRGAFPPQLAPRRLWAGPPLPGGRRGLVAWARTLRMALGRLVETGGVPDGVALTGAVRI
jgi:transposase